jgi:zinc protease
LDGVRFPANDAVVIPLPCGIDLIYKEDRSAPIVSVQTWVKTGSILEAEHLGSGISHLVEHMVFQAAGERGPGELAHAVQATGGYLNAYTSFDRTVYWIETLREGLETALGVLADLTTAAHFKDAEFLKEKDVIRREIDMGKDDPGRSLNQLMFRTVYREHPFREPVIGRIELFDGLARDTAFAYYRERYVPDRMFIVIVGDVEASIAEAQAQAAFAKVTPRSPVSTLVAAEPPQTSRREMHVEFGTELTRAELAWRIPGLLHPDTAALEVLGTLLGQGRTSRLYRHVRERLGLAHSVGAGAYTPPQEGIFYASLTCDPEKRVAAEQAVLDQVRALCDAPVDDADVARARRLFLADQLGGLTTAGGQAGDVGSNWLCAGDLDFTRNYLTLIDHVTPADVQRVAQRYLRDEALSSVSLNPTGTLAKASVHVAKRVASEIQRHVLPDGLTLLVKEDPRLPLVTLHASLRGGLLVEDAARNGIGRLMARTLVKGTTTRSADDLADLVEAVGGSYGADSGGSSWSCSVGVLTPDLDLGLDVWSDLLLRPAFAEDSLARERERQIAALKQQEDHPSFLAFRELRRVAYGAHPFAMNREGTPESLAAITRADLCGLHQQSLVRENAVLAVFGDVSADHILKNLEATMKSLPAGARPAFRELPALPSHVGQTLTITKDKRQAFVVASFPTVALDHPDHLALSLIDEVCSDMASRFFDRIRETHGLAYSVGATQILGMCPGMFAFYLSTSPEKMEFAQAELLQEIALLAAHGLTAEEVDRAAKKWIGKHAMQMQNTGEFAQSCALDELYGKGYDYHHRALAHVRDLKLADINDACARYFTGTPLVVRVTP